MLPRQKNKNETYYRSARAQFFKYFQLHQTNFLIYLDLSQFILVHLILPLAISGYLWLSCLGLSWIIPWLYLRLSQTISGYLLLSYCLISDYLGLSLAILASLAISGYLELYWAILDYIDQSRSISVYLWLSLVISGYLLLSLAISGYLWLSLAIYKLSSIRLQVEAE